ncbi:SDR family oxidoreductase [bacterium]|nr:SDR family oxidoreductase [bacterium]
MTDPDESPSPDHTRPILLTGATGYVGGRLRRALEERGLPVRCLVRRPRELEGRVGPRTELLGGDLMDPPSVASALRGAGAAFYLVHSMGGPDDFAETDRRAATTFAEAARAAGVERIIYLGGLGRGPGLSPHLASRQEVGRILRESGVPTLELRSSIIIGSGSLSFELIRALVNRLPVMTTPRWVAMRTQPIAIEDVLEILAQSVDVPLPESRVLEIGGPDRVSYGDIMREYARQAGLRRVLVPLPVLSPRLSSLWLGLITPIYARIGRDLIESVINETIVESDDAQGVFSIHPRGIEAAIDRALRHEEREFAETRWSDALSSGRSKPRYGGETVGGRIVDSRAVHVPCPPSEAFAPVRRIGGRTGWYYGTWLWRVRGFLDLLAGGVGVRRGRRDPEHVSPGDALDFWRVEDVKDDRLLRLRAEMKVPGRAWLQFEVEPDGDGSEVRQTAIFEPRGLFGLAYWYALYPLHTLVFAGMLKGIARAATRESGVSGDATAQREARSVPR